MKSLKVPLGRRVNMAALPDHPIRRPLPGQDLKKQESVLDDKTSALHVHPPHERRIYSEYLRSPRSPPPCCLFVRWESAEPDSQHR